MRQRPALALLFAVALHCLPGCATLQDAGLGDILAGGDRPLEESTVVAGLKEALHVGTERSVLSVGAVDGYLANELIRIALPEQLAGVASTLRDLGLGAHVDELETGMNRAAELAAGEARAVFWDAIRSMTIADGFAILNGGRTAATDYFRERTWQALESRYRPIARDKMQEVGLSRLYGRALDVYNAVPLVDKPPLVELDEYVTHEALSGLFTVLAQEEGRIRSDPLARTTDLLKRVFGR